MLVNGHYGTEGSGAHLICNSFFVLTCHVFSNYPCTYCILLNIFKDYIIIHYDNFLKNDFKN